MGAQCSKDDSAGGSGGDGHRRKNNTVKYAEKQTPETAGGGGGGADGLAGGASTEEEYVVNRVDSNHGPGYKKYAQLLPNDTAAMCVTAGPFPGTAIVGGEDKKLHYVNYVEGRKISTSFKAHEKDINKMVYHQGTDRLYTASRDSLVKGWSLGANCGDGEGNLDETPTATFQGHRLNVTGVSVSRDGLRLVTGSRDNSTRLWDTTTGDLLNTQDIKLNVVHWVEWMEELGCVAQGGEDLTVRLYDFRAAGGSARDTLDLTDTMGNFDYHPICVTKHCSSPHTIYTGHNGFSTTSCMVTEWDLRMKKQVQHWKGKHTNTVRRVLHSSSLRGFGGRPVLLSTSDDESMCVWDPTVPITGDAEEETKRFVRQYRIPEGRVTSMEETPSYWAAAAHGESSGGSGNLLLSLRTGAVLATSFETPLKKGSAPPRLLRNFAFQE